MAKTSIEWTDASWNPVVGCTEVSPGCANCYAARLAATRLRDVASYRGLAIGTIEKIPQANSSARYQRGAIRWTGEVRRLPKRLAEPWHWKKPLRIFVCDMGDLFHEEVPHSFLIQVFQVMAQSPQHTYQILTKRPERMREWLSNFEMVDRHHPMRDDCRWPWPNVWCGVSVENQHFADERIPLLLRTPAAVRWISAEPLLGPVNFEAPLPIGSRLDWVVVGGESGPNARPMHPDWVRAFRDQCVAAGVPFFFKQWGEYKGVSSLADRIDADRRKCVTVGNESPTGAWMMAKVGKKKSGRLLDGRTWDEFPVVMP